MASYYDLDDLLMEEELLPAIFRVSADGVGPIDPGSEDNNVEQGARIDLPLWLAQDLFNRNAIVINLPSCFSQKVRKEIQADPGCVDLRSRCPYFYELGCRLVPLGSDVGLGSFLLTALRGRYKDTLCKAHSSALTSTPKFMQLLTREETNLFEAGRDSMKAFKKWRIRGARLERATVLGRKRRANPLLPPTSNA